MSDLDLLDNSTDELDLLDDDLMLDPHADKQATKTEDALVDMALNAADLSDANFNLIKDIPVEITVEVSRKTLPLKEIMNFESGGIIMLDKKEGEPVDIKINGVLFGTGSIIAEDGKYGVRILSMVKNDQHV